MPRRRRSASTPTDGRNDSTKQIFFRRANELACSSHSVRRPHSLHNHRRNLADLTHDYSTGSGEFIGQRNHGRLKNFPFRIAHSTVIDQWCNPSDTERDIHQAFPPGSPKCIGNDHGDVNAKCSAELFVKGAGGAIGILRQQRCRSDWNIRYIHTGIRTDKAMVRPYNDHATLHSYNAARFSQHNFDNARILVVFTSPAFRSLRRLNRIEGHHPSFCLGHNFLRNHENVSRLENKSLSLDGFNEQPGKVVAPGNFGQPRQGNNLDWRRIRFPVHVRTRSIGLVGRRTD